jgi:hypothetical protein
MIRGQGFLMSEVTLSVPFVVTSTTLGPSGEVEKHVLTPFGDIDLTIQIVSNDGSEELVVDIQMGAGAGCWMVADPTFFHFKRTLVQFVRGLLEEILSDSPSGIPQVRIHFWGLNEGFLFLDLPKGETSGLPADTVYPSA